MLAGQFADVDADQRRAESGGLTLDDDAHETLVALLGEDRLSTRSDRQALVAAHGRERITPKTSRRSFAMRSTTCAHDAVLQAFRRLDYCRAPSSGPKRPAGSRSVDARGGVTLRGRFTSRPAAISSRPIAGIGDGLVFRSGIGVAMRAADENFALGRGKTVRAIRTLCRSGQAHAARTAPCAALAERGTFVDRGRGEAVEM